MPNVFTGQEFAKNLSKGEITESITKIGMAKKSDNSADAILFAEGGTCSDWISIPIAAIEQVTLISSVTCRDHRHPLVMIQFKEPDPKNESANLFAELARRNQQAAPTQPVPGVPGRPPETLERRVDGGQPADGAGGLKCIAWHQVCGWTTLYISSLGINIPFYACWNVCDTYGLPFGGRF